MTGLLRDQRLFFGVNCKCVMSDIWNRVSPNLNQIGVRAYIMQRRSSCLEADNFSRLLSRGRHEANRILGQQIMLPYPAGVIEIDIPSTGGPSGYAPVVRGFRSLMPWRPKTLAVSLDRSLEWARGVLLRERGTQPGIVDGDFWNIRVP